MAIWEGSGNVIALDVLRALSREQVRHAPTAVSEAFIESRLGPNRTVDYGALPTGTDLTAILSRH